MLDHCYYQDLLSTLSNSWEISSSSVNVLDFQAFLNFYK